MTKNIMTVCLYIVSKFSSDNFYIQNQLVCKRFICDVNLHNFVSDLKRYLNENRVLTFEIIQYDVCRFGLIWILAFAQIAGK